MINVEALTFWDGVLSVIAICVVPVSAWLCITSWRCHRKLNELVAWQSKQKEWNRRNIHDKNCERQEEKLRKDYEDLLACMAKPHAEWKQIQAEDISKMLRRLEEKSDGDWIAREFHSRYPRQQS
jgi:hypothetical protein